MSGIVRILRPSDVEDYRTIRLATLATEPDFFGSVHAVEVLQPLSHFGDALASDAVFGAYVDGVIAGVIRYRQGVGPKERHKGSLGGFFVRPDYRRQGLGAGLMTAALATARDQVEHVTLTVVQGNTAAIALYQHFHFVTYGVEPRARKDAGRYFDMAHMMLVLDPAATGEAAVDP